MDYGGEEKYDRNLWSRNEFDLWGLRRDDMKRLYETVCSGITEDEECWKVGMWRNHSSRKCVHLE